MIHIEIFPLQPEDYFFINYLFREFRFPCCKYDYSSFHKHSLRIRDREDLNIYI